MLIELLLGFVALIFFGGFWLGYRKRANEALWASRGLPVLGAGKTGGFFKALFRMRDEKWTFVSNELDMYDEFKGHKIGVVMEFGRPIFFARDLDLIKRICIKDFDHFVNRRGFTLEKTDPHMHLSVFNQSGDDWKNLRSKMTPTFTTGKIRRMFPIFQSSSHKLVNSLKKEIAKRGESAGSNVELREFLQKLTMDVIARVAFGWETDIYENSNSTFAEMGKKILDLFSGKNIFKIIFSVIFGAKMTELFKIKLMDDKADEFFSKIVIQTLSHRAKTGEIRDDFIQLMIEARANQNEGSAKFEFTDDVIIAQCLIFFLAGFDTVESALIFTLYELALNPEVQTKLREELQQTLKNSENPGEFTYDAIQNLEYLDMVLSETMRKFPPAFRTDRRATQPYKLPDSDYTLPKDSLVVIPIIGLHKDPEIWPDPEKFDPLRFTKEEIAKRHPSAYQPFGIGPRSCIANRYALVECKTAIAHFVLNFELSACEKTEIPPVLVKSGSMKPKRGMWLNVTPIRSSSSSS